MNKIILLLSLCVPNIVFAAWTEESITGTVSGTEFTSLVIVSTSMKITGELNITGTIVGAINSSVQDSTTTLNTKINTVANNIGISTNTQRTDFNALAESTGTVVTQSSATTTYTHLEVHRSSMTNIENHKLDKSSATEIMRVTYSSFTNVERDYVTKSSASTTYVIKNATDTITGGLNITGSVGIGTTNPDQPLTVVTNATSYTGLAIKNTDVSDREWAVFAGANAWAQASSKGFGIRDITGGLTRLSIDTSGNVGINVTIPDQKLNVIGGISASGIIVSSGGFYGDGSNLTGISAGVGGSTATITINGGGFTIPSVNGAINYKDEYLIDGTSVPFDITIFDEAVIQYGYKTIFAPNFLDDTKGYTINLIWTSTQTANEVVWDIGISTTANFRTDVFYVTSATTTVSATANNINTTTISLGSQSIVAGAPFKIRLRRIADSPQDDMVGDANVISLNIQYRRLW